VSPATKTTKPNPTAEPSPLERFAAAEDEFAEAEQAARSAWSEHAQLGARYPLPARFSEWRCFRRSSPIWVSGSWFGLSR
jgi:hypothetical protein